MAAVSWRSISTGLTCAISCTPSLCSSEKKKMASIRRDWPAAQLARSTQLGRLEDSLPETLLCTAPNARARGLKSEHLLYILVSLQVCSLNAHCSWLGAERSCTTYRQPSLDNEWPDRWPSSTSLAGCFTSSYAGANHEPSFDGVNSPWYKSWVLVRLVDTWLSQPPLGSS